MGLRIRTNIASLRAQRHLSKTTLRSQDNMAKLASGKRINKAADDAAGLGISENMKAQIRSMVQARRNANDGISMIQIAEGGMAEVNNMLVRIRELAVQAASDTLGNKERSFANREYTALVDEIERITRTTRYNDYVMLGGSEVNAGMEELVIHAGAGDGSAPNTDTIILDIDAIKLSVEEGFGLGRGDEIGPQQVEDGFNRADAAAKLTVIDGAIQQVSSKRATLGALQSRMNSAVRNLSIAVENTSEARSRILDTDFAVEAASFTQEKILGQAGVSVLSQANMAPEVVLALLR